MHTEPQDDAGKPAGTNTVTTAWLLPVLVNIVLPIVTYFALTASGVADVPALLISGGWPALEIAYTMRKQHQVDEFSIFVMIGIIAGVATTAVSDDARAAFLKDSITSGIVGAAFLVSLIAGRPLTFYFGRRFATDGSKAQRDWWNGLWRHPRFRLVQRRLGAAWGLALLIEAVGRGVLTWELGTSSMVLVNNVVPFLVIAIMIGVSVSVGQREQARAQHVGASGAAPPQPA